MREALSARGRVRESVRRRAFAVFSAVAMAGLALSPSSSGAGPLSIAYASPDPTVSAQLNVTAVFAGITLNSTERAQLIDGVDATWTPAVTSLRLPLGINFTVRVRLVEASGAFAAGYAQFLNASFANDTLVRQVRNYIGLFENVSPYQPGWTEDTLVRHADGEMAADWLAGAAGDFPEVGAPEGEARLFFLNPTDVSDPYYYTLQSRDLDRAADFEYETANAWADGSGVFFQDLRAAPGHLGEFSGTGRPADFAGMPPAWSYLDTPAERARLLGDLSHYIDRSVKALVAPSFGLTPFDTPSVALQVTVFDGTSGQTLFAPGGTGAAHGINRTEDILNTSLVESALHALAPYAVFSAQVGRANRTSDALLALSVENNGALLGPATVLDPFGINRDLKARWNVPLSPVEPGESVSIPVLIALLDGETWVDSKDVRGVTLQRSDGRAAAIVIAAGLAQLETRGLSETVIHEAGHALGFGHPHEVSSLLPNGTVSTEVDWLRSSTSTPMTYLPAYVDYSFDSFDRHAMWVAVAAATLKASFAERQAAFTLLEALGYSGENVPPAIAGDEAVFEGFANETRTLLSRGILYIEADPPYTDGGAIVMAKRAFDEAKDISVKALATARCCGAAKPPGFLPGPEGALALIAVGVAAVVAVAVLRRRP